MFTACQNNPRLVDIFIQYIISAFFINTCRVWYFLIGSECQLFMYFLITCDRIMHHYRLRFMYQTAHLFFQQKKRKEKKRNLRKEGHIKQIKKHEKKNPAWKIHDMFVGQSGLPPVKGYLISRKDVFSATMFCRLGRYNIFILLNTQLVYHTVYLHVHVL